MQKILSNIANSFVDNKLLNEIEAIKITNIILEKNNFEKINFLICKEKNISLEKHMKYINDLRIFFSEKIKNDLLVENKINETLSFFLPTQETINETWIDKNKFQKLHQFSLFSYYIKDDKNKENIVWNHNSKYGNIIISINKAKPEKKQEDIIREKNLISNNINEPKCPICIENIGFKGSEKKDSRENLRVIFEDLNTDDKWFFQYSPYAYLNEHFILNNIKHTPMIISNNSIKELTSFIEKYDNYFLGSNADLSIVGGSLLGHNHYQGGDDILPIMNAKTELEYTFNESKIEILNWPLNVIKISSILKNKFIETSNYFINSWKLINNDLIKPFNNSTTIIVKKENKRFVSYLIFRNNSVSKENPFGNFHIRENKFNIKQENIGLMEAGGLAILPKRLITEFEEIEDYYLNNNDRQNVSKDSFIKHNLLINKLLENKINITKDNLLKEIGDIFVSCLEDCKVLSDKDFNSFIKETIVEKVLCLKVKNNNDLKIEVLNKGFIVKQISLLKDEFLLEYSNIEDYYKNNDILLNAFVGPIAGRIEDGIVFFDNNRKIELTKDENNNYIHGMNEKWSNLDYELEVLANEKEITIIGYAKQFNHELECEYTIKNNITISMNKNDFSFLNNIKSDKETICNPTHHFYWNFPHNKDIFDLNVKIEPKSFWLLNKNSNPHIEIACSNNHFKNIKELSSIVFEKQKDQKEIGIDHPFCLKDKNIVLSTKDNQYKLKINSTMNTLVIYTHNWPSKNKLKNRKGKNQGICFEFQKIPTSKANPNYNEIILKQGEEYNQETNYLIETKIIK